MRKKAISSSIGSSDGSVNGRMWKRIVLVPRRAARKTRQNQKEARK